MYELTQHSYISDDSIPYIGYGIHNLEHNILINDITTDKDSLENLITKINRNDLSPIHIYDVIEDFLLCFAVN